MFLSNPLIKGVHNRVILIVLHVLFFKLINTGKLCINCFSTTVLNQLKMQKSICLKKSF